MRRGTWGTGVERKAEEVRPRQPGCPLPLKSAQGNSPHPHPSRDCGAGEEGGGCARRLFSSSLLQTRVGKGSARSAAPRGCSAPSPDARVRSVPAACLARSRPKCPKRRRALGTCPAAVRRAPRGLPALAHPQPGVRGSWSTRRRGAGNLNRLWSPRSRAAETQLQARVLLFEVEGAPGQWI